MKERYGPWALIIGGSDGTGLAFATRLAGAGINLALTGRRLDALESAASTLRDHGVEVRILAQDMTAPDMMERVAAFTADIEIGLLIYNAGAVAEIGPFLDGDVDGPLRAIRLNCEGPTLLAHHYGRAMRARGRGGIIMMSSLAALAGSYGVAVYGATKAFDLQLAEGLWYELKDDGVDVLGIVIGSTRTPTYERSMPAAGAENAAEPDDIAQEALDSLANGPVLYAQSIAPVLPMVIGTDRRATVTMFGDSSRAFLGDAPNAAPLGAPLPMN